MKKFFIFLIGIVIAILVFGFLISNKTEFNNGTNSQDFDNGKNLPQSSFESKELNGFSLSPGSFSPEDFSNFFIKAEEGGDAITGGEDLEKLANQNAAPYVVAGIAKQRDYEPIVLIGLKNIKEADENKKILLLNFLDKHEINYLGLGVEVNRYEDYDAYSKVYNDLYEFVKEKYPNIQIFPIYQYEEMRGLRGGLFGGTNDENNVQWNLLDKVKFDMIGFTTYPGLIYKTPTEIPDNYYLEIKKYTAKPVVFTEIGWFGEFDSIAGWESSEKEQAEFVERYFLLTNDLDVRLNIWSFLYPQGRDELFSKMGLLKEGEESSLGFDAWKKGR